MRICNEPQYAAKNNKKAAQCAAFLLNAMDQRGPVGREVTLVFLTSSSILKVECDEPANRRLRSLPRQRRSRVLRRVRLRSATMELQ